MNYINVKQMAKLRESGFTVDIAHIRDEDSLDELSKTLFFNVDGEVTHPVPDSFSAITECVISKGSRTVATGRAFCSTKDEFSRNAGSSIAFRRALRNISMPRDKRAKLLRVG